MSESDARWEVSVDEGEGAVLLGPDPREPDIQRVWARCPDIIAAEFLLSVVQYSESNFYRWDLGYKDADRRSK